MFSRREMDRRYAPAQEAMTARGLDALLVTGEENFQYFTGSSASLALHYSLSRPNVLILPRRGEPVVLTQTKEYMTLSSYITEFREYFDVLHFPHDARRRHAGGDRARASPGRCRTGPGAAVGNSGRAPTWTSSRRCRVLNSSTPPTS